MILINIIALAYALWVEFMLLDAYVMWVKVSQALWKILELSVYKCNVPQCSPKDFAKPSLLFPGLGVLEKANFSRHIEFDLLRSPIIHA